MEFETFSNENASENEEIQSDANYENSLSD